MTYVVTGASGNTGAVVANPLLAAGEKVRVVVRSKEKAEPFVRAGAEVAIADVSDTASMARALAGARGAYLLLPPITNAADTLGAQKQISDALASAVAESRVPHVVLLSSIGAELESGTGPILTTREAERRFASLPGTALTVLRPAYFMENLQAALGGRAQGVFNTFLTEGRAYSMVATADIGALAALKLREGPKGHEAIQLTGPEELQLEQVVAAFEAAAGKKLKLQVAPTAAMHDVLTSFG